MKKIVETDFLLAAPNDDDEVKMNVQKVLVPRIILGLSSFISPVSLAPPKPLSSNMDSISVLPTKKPSFVSSNFYPPM